MILVSLLLLPGLLQDPAPDLEALLAQSRSLPPAAALELADTLDLPEAGWPAWRDALAARLEASRGTERLFAARLLAQGDSPAGGPALMLLLDGEPELAAAAAATLAHPAFDLDEPTMKALGSWLSSREPDAQAPVYTEAAVSLYRIGDGARRRAARQYLRNALSSPSETVYTDAALAMARVGEREDPAVRREIQRLAAGFGPRAVLAGTLLQSWREIDRERRRSEAFQRYARQRAPQGEGAPNAAGLDLFSEVLATVEQRHMEGERFTREELVEAAANGMLRRLDPHSSFMSGEEYGKFFFDLNPEYGGIGAYVNTVNDVFTIIRPIYSGPAYEAGLRTDDKILEVDGWSTYNQPNDEIIRRLKGEPHSKVVVKVMRRGFIEPKEFTITRRRIDIPTVQSEHLPGGILYLELLNFSADCADRIKNTILGARREGWLQGVVLDLRNNPGGYLNQAVDICDVFLPPRKRVVRTRSRTSKEQSMYTRRPALVPEDIPLAILVNRFSASASEIVSGVLSQYGRAVTVGERTFGKGSIQNLIDLRSRPDEPWKDENHNNMHDDWEEYTDRNGNGQFDYGPRMRLTVGYYFLPDGTTIHTQRDHDGRILEDEDGNLVGQGGVVPQVEVDFPRIEVWKIREITRLLEENRFKEYASRIHDEDRDLAMALAEFDGADTSRYPGWDAFYSALETDLEPQVVRQYVRLHLRAIVSDDRGRVFAGNGLFGDFVEDPQLQEAIRQIVDPQHAGAPLAAEYAEVFSRTAPAADEPDAPQPN